MALRYEIVARLMENSNPAATEAIQLNFLINDCIIRV